MTSTSLAGPARCRPLGQDARAGVDPGSAPDAQDDAPGPEGLGHLVLTADFLFASGGALLEGDRGHDLDPPSLAEAGAHEIGTRVLVALAGRDGAVVAGLVPWHRDTRLIAARERGDALEVELAHALTGRRSTVSELARHP